MLCDVHPRCITQLSTHFYMLLSDTMKLISCCFCILMAIVSCELKNQSSTETNGAFMKASNEKQINIDRIVKSGELIITTMSGPDTYFDYQGARLGIQYALVEHFANSLGIGIRVELASDTTEMIRKLHAGEVDLIAFQLPEDFCKQEDLRCAGADNATAKTSWAIRNNEEDFANELDFWYSQDIEIVIKKVQGKRLQARHHVKHKINAPFISREKGIISIYDNHFKKAAQQLGWDWKLLAAQCYQESAFDPNAISYMGAQGLMQIMSSTAEHLQLASHRIFVPSDNIGAATRYLRELQEKFKPIHNKEEQIKFILAAYNGGFGHVLDAQALARKYGKNPHRWNDVSQFILKLSEPHYYRDPLVKYGYMIGSETYSYVSDILKRWRTYGGEISRLDTRGHSSSEDTASPIHDEKGFRRKPNKYSKVQKIYSLDELNQP